MRASPLYIRRPRLLAVILFFSASKETTELRREKTERRSFPAVMTMSTERVGLPLPPPLPPRPVSRLRLGFYGPARPTQPAFVSPPLPDIWQCVEATWRQPLRTKAPVATWVGILRVQGRSDTECPGLPRFAPVCPPLDESLAAHLLPQAVGWAEGRKPLPPLPCDREILEQQRPVISACWVSR